MKKIEFETNGGYLQRGDYLVNKWYMEFEDDGTLAKIIFRRKDVTEIIKTKNKDYDEYHTIKRNVDFAKRELFPELFKPKKIAENKMYVTLEYGYGGGNFFKIGRMPYSKTCKFRGSISGYWVDEADEEKIKALVKAHKDMMEEYQLKIDEIRKEIDIELKKK